MNSLDSGDFSLAYYSGDRRTGAVSVVRRQGGKTTVESVHVDPESGLEKLSKPVFIGLTSAKQIVLFDPKSKEIRIQAGFPADAFAAHIYPEPDSERDWFMNDGDKETGNDTVNCGNEGSSVTVIENASTSSARFLKTICVGRGHHQAMFAAPSRTIPDVPRRAYVSNLLDGTISVIGNDPDDGDTYLNVLATINLCEPEKEGLVASQVPNKAFPHGLVYSSVSGKLYCLNNGYGSIAVIDPKSNVIVDRIAFKGHSNLFGAPDGRYLIGRGADRKSNANHVVAKVSVLDTLTHEVVDKVDLQDIYISKYFFNPEGSKLYLTTAISGSPEQQANLKTDALLIFDMSALPRIKLDKEVRLGSAAGTLDFRYVAGKTQLVFSSNSEEGSVALIDGETGDVLEKIRVNEGTVHSRLWTLS